MQEHEDQPNVIRDELLERLRAVDQESSAGSLTELAYHRASEALERALEEARSIRLQAIDDARTTRERELNALMESMRSLRRSAEVQVEALLRTAEIEASRLRDQTRADSQAILDRAAIEAADIRAEAAAVKTLAESRLHEAERLEADFNQLVTRLAERLGIKEPAGGWWQHLTRNR